MNALSRTTLVNTHSRVTSCVETCIILSTLSLCNDTEIFKIVNDEPIYSPVLFSLDCYKKLYMQDKSELKSNFAKHLLYIYYSCDPKSPYFEIENKVDGIP